MNQFLHLFRHDFKLLYRNRIILVSAFVTVLYILAFKGLSVLGNMEQLLVLVIFNDPALLGFLFIGVMILFEKNENTLQALAVTPFSAIAYLLSKSVSLTAIALACCLAMGMATRGTDLHFAHFITASVLTSTLFSFLGFMTVSGVDGFNTYILRALGVLMLLSLPFIGYFGLVSRQWFLFFPTQPAVDLYAASFDDSVSVGRIIYAYSALLAWNALGFLAARKALIKHLYV